MAVMSEVTMAEFLACSLPDPGLESTCTIAASDYRAAEGGIVDQGRYTSGVMSCHLSFIHW